MGVLFSATLLFVYDIGKFCNTDTTLLTLHRFLVYCVFKLLIYLLETLFLSPAVLILPLAVNLNRHEKF